MCGEHCAMASTSHPRSGSSPRVRGALGEQVARLHLRGIIPACAGSTGSRQASPRPWRDHPRVCGEHHAFASSSTSRRGSSPRVRGARSDGKNMANRSGIIPACAGSTRCPRATRPAAGDHPRVCGEHAFLTDTTGNRRGSSPRVRGARPRPPRVDEERGIIPACAGSTSRAVNMPSRRRDHPRVCGEHNSHGRRWRESSGSSPRVRGARYAPIRWIEPQGIIPACAGSTHRAHRGRSHQRDHPRVCGEHDKPFNVIAGE